MVRKPNYKAQALIERALRRTRREPISADRMSMELRWLRNWLYYMGSNRLRMNSALGEWEEYDVDRSYYSANLIKPTVLRTVTRLVGQLPIAKVAPETSDPQDMHAARLGEQALLHLFDRVAFQREMEGAVTDAAVTGLGFIKTAWDHQAGPIMEFVTDEKGNAIEAEIAPELREELVAKGQVKQQNIGDVDIHRVSPFAMMWDNDITSPNLDNARWVAELTVTRRSAIVRDWGEDLADEVTYNSEGIEPLLSQRLKNQAYAGTFGLLGTAGNEEDGDDQEDPKVLVREYWEAPTKEYPNGVRLILAGDTLLWGGPNRYVSTDMDFVYPYQAIRWSEETERFAVDGLVDQLFPTQEEWNATRSMIAANIAAMANPWWVVAKGTEVQVTRIDGLVGSIMEFAGSGPPPRQESAAPLPPYVAEHLNTLQMEFQMISADQDPNAMTAPSAARSGPVLQAMEDRSRSVLSSTKSAVDECIRRVARNSLQLMAANYTEPRLIKTAGEAMSFEVQSFLGVDLRENYDVRIFVESGNMQSTAARQQTILNYVEMGILDPTNPDDKRAILRSLEFGDPSAYVTSKLTDERTAQWENEVLRTGQHALVLPWHDHQVHIEQMDMVMKSVAFLHYDKKVQEAFYQHRMQHEEALAMMAEAQMAQEAAASGSQVRSPGRASAPKRNQQ